MIDKSSGVNIAGTKVCIAIPCYSGYLPLELSLALITLTSECSKYGVDLSIISERENSLVTETRNKLLTEFLKDTDSDYLFWIDDDIIFEPLSFFQILALCITRKSVAATYCTRTDDDPTFFIKMADGSDVMKFNEDGLVESKGVGLGFACQHRSILEPLLTGKDSYLNRKKELIWDVFKIGARNGQYVGEDMNFFNELHQNGYITYVHPFVHLKHVGRKDYDHRLMTKKEN